MTRRRFSKFSLLFAPSLALAVDPFPQDWTEPFPAHRVMDNLYYVGSKSLASFLVATPTGHILINSSLPANVPMIESSIKSLGFRFEDVKVLLISHAHWDHCAGSRLMQQRTPAQYMVMAPDVSVVESGGRTDFNYGSIPEYQYAAAKVDRILHDGDTVKFGGSVLTAHLTPGHTKGCTTWTMQLSQDGKAYNVVIVGSPNVNTGYKLVKNPTYPNISHDYESCFRVMESLPCDIFLGAHGGYYNLEGKYPRMAAGQPNPFIDSQGYRDYVADRKAAFAAELKKQQV